MPGFLGGTFTPNPRFWPHLVRRQSAAATIRFFHGLRKKYGTRAWSWFPFGSTLLVLDGAGIEEVLASPKSFADPLSTFTPHGAIISGPPAWQGRRDLNDEALAFRETRHPDREPFVTIVQSEVQTMLDAKSAVLAWPDFTELAAKISQQIIFGSGEYQEDVARHLARLVSAGHWGIIRRPADCAALYKRIDEQMEGGGRLTGGHALVQRAASSLATLTSATDAKASSQIGFWLFVVKDAIELHTVRTLALIACAPESVRQRLTNELDKHKPLAADSIEKLDFLEACIKEAWRLWTPIPNLLRVAREEMHLKDGVRIAKGQQILLHTGSYHRDPDVFGITADAFAPEQRLTAHRRHGCPFATFNPPLYVFSRHQQSCSGQFLITFLLKAVLASLLVNNKFILLDDQVPMDPVPAAINHFAIRFWRR